MTASDETDASGRDTIAGLRDRVSAATGPDRGLDRQIMVAMFGEGARNALPLPAYTGSIDSALALVERLLPGWSVRLYVHPDAAYADLYRLGELAHFPEGKVERRITSDYHEGNFIQHRLPALAIILALLNALLHTEAKTP